MKKYSVFAGDQFYPSGGFADFVATTDDWDTAVNLVVSAMKNGSDWFQIVDNTRLVVISDEFTGIRNPETNELVFYLDK
jgi:hypothetical protein